MGTSADYHMTRSFPLYGPLGVFLIVLAELGLVFKIETVEFYFTPIVWTGYILFIDALLWSRKKSSRIFSRPKDFLRMMVWSVFCWLIFEGYNIYLQNWKYVNLPSSILAQGIGYVWSFATIFPAVLLTAEILENNIHRFKFKISFQLSPFLQFLLITVGGLMLATPLALPQETSSNLFGFVWVGFILLVDPVNYANKRDSIIGRLSHGDASKLAALFLSGLCCGLLWEFWNYWATAKWVYTIPALAGVPKLFEMPLVGYLGFLPFAVECYVMNEFSYVLFPRLQNLDA